MHILIFYYYYDDNDVIMYVQGPISKIFMEILFYFRFFFDGLNKTRQELERFIDTKEIYMHMYTEEGIRV